MIWGFLDDFIQNSGIIFLFLFLAPGKAVAPLANNPIMSGRSIQSLRHLEHQNLSIITDSIRIYRWLQKNAKKWGGGGVGNPIIIEEDNTQGIF